MTAGSLVAWKSSRRIRSAAVSLMARRLPHGWLASQTLPRLIQGALDQHDITPFAVQSAVAQVSADHAEPATLNQPHARVVRGEELAEQLVETAPGGLPPQLREQGGPDPSPAQGRVDVDAALRDAGVRVAVAVRRGRCEARHPAVEVGHEEGVALSRDPIGDLRGLAFARLEGRAPLADSGAVDVRDRGGVLRARRAYASLG